MTKRFFVAMLLPLLACFVVIAAGGSSVIAQGGVEISNVTLDKAFVRPDEDFVFKIETTESFRTVWFSTKLVFSHPDLENPWEDCRPATPGAESSLYLYSFSTGSSEGPWNVAITVHSNANCSTQPQDLVEEIVTFDETFPEIAFQFEPSAPNENGWYNQDVIVNTICTDNISVGSRLLCDPPTPQIIRFEGETRPTGLAIDQAGNTTEATSSRVIRIDKTIPELTVEAEGGRFAVDSTIGVPINAMDANPDTVTIEGLVDENSEPVTHVDFGESQTFLDTRTAGQFTWSVTAIDLAGNLAIQTGSYEVANN